MSLVVAYESPLDKIYDCQSVAEVCKQKNIDFISSPKISPLLQSKIKEISPGLIFLFALARESLLKFLIFPREVPLMFIQVFLSRADSNNVGLENGEEFGVTIHKIGEI